jgi:ABC-type antimicrobial peptide transport system permease subunit
MFFTYLGRELRRRMRQAVFAALGLAVGIGLVITVTAASAGVRDAQSTVLHSLYGVGTDITVTKAPSANSGGPFGFRVGQRPRSFTRPKAGTKFTRSTLISRGLGTLSTSAVSSVSALHGVAAAGGGLALTNLSVSGTIPSAPSGGGFGGGGGFGRPSNFKVSSFTVNGTDLSAGAVGPLSSAKVVSGRTFTGADATADDAVVDAGFARQNKLSTGSAITVGGTSFKVIGIVSQPQGASPPSVYVPLARAQALAGMKNDVNTIYVAADSAADIGAVSRQIKTAMPAATVTNSSTLASDVTGSITSAASLANNLGRWLAVAVLAAAFLLASLLMMTAVSHRVREFGTLKALGWRSRRIVGQVMGEAVAIGIAGGIIGVALGFAGARLVATLAPPLTASTGLATGSATPGGARAFGPPGGFAGPGGGPGGTFRRLFGDAGTSLNVHLTAPVTVAAVLLAVALAIAGGLIAGGFGSWRAARLRPAAALARVQ